MLPLSAPRAASIKPSTDKAPHHQDGPEPFSCSARAAVKAARALASSFVIRAIRPSRKRGLYFDHVITTRFRRTPLKHWQQQRVPLRQCAVEPAIGDLLDCSRILLRGFHRSIDARDRVSAFQSNSTNARARLLCRRHSARSQRAIQHGFFLGIAPKLVITLSNLV